MEIGYDAYLRDHSVQYLGANINTLPNDDYKKERFPCSGNSAAEDKVTLTLHSTLHSTYLVGAAPFQPPLIPLVGHCAFIVDQRRKVWRTSAICHRVVVEPD